MIKAPMEATTRRMILPDWLCDYLNKRLPGSVVNSDFSQYVMATISARAEYTVERPDLIEGLISSIDKDVSPLPLHSLPARPDGRSPALSGHANMIIQDCPQGHNHAHGDTAPRGWL
jgi:hypothetical protein